MGAVSILAIESSCDDTGAAVIVGDLDSAQPKFTVLSSVVNSQIPLHKSTGGVIPEVAARAHVRNVRPVTEAALAQAGMSLNEIDYVAVTAGPGLIVSLMVGVEFAKTLAMATGKKIIPVNHMAGHLYSIFGASNQWRGRRTVAQTAVKFPLMALVVSGGHTMLILMHDYLHFEVLGQTVDDAAGEAFDKVARLLGLPYPGGPAISKLALRGKPSIEFPRPMMHTKNYDFSFSGLKTAVLYYMRDHAGAVGQSRGNRGGKKISMRQKADIAASFQQAVVDVLISKTLRAAIEHKAKTVSLSGGVAANTKLRETIAQSCKKSKLNFLVPEIALCTDNAAMIGIAAYFRLRSGFKPVNFSRINADSNWEL